MNDPAEHTVALPLLASDAERERAVAQLQHHYAVGRLTMPELESRVVVAYRARTRADLDALLKDLPGEPERRLQPQQDPIDTRLLIILACVAPPAALVYWIIAQRGTRRSRLRPRALEPAPEREGGTEA
ncbi:DUF1707 domain-containing protein [Streptomyces sp. NPDC059340]|uniref:DUF1707 SHOCT-like domain-containing protein n=1 Tax=Streptomyces sp. NPDC059340 TaxID=3346806 RepID=UPI0036C168EB